MSSPSLNLRLRADAVYARHEGQGERAKLMEEAAEALNGGSQRSVLKEAEDEIARTIADIVGARGSNAEGTAHPRFDEVSQRELARLEGILGRIRAALRDT